MYTTTVGGHCNYGQLGSWSSSSSASLRLLPLADGGRVSHRCMRFCPSSGAPEVQHPHLHHRVLKLPGGNLDLAHQQSPLIAISTGTGAPRHVMRMQLNRSLSALQALLW